MRPGTDFHVVFLHSLLVLGQLEGDKRHFWSARHVAMARSLDGVVALDNHCIGCLGTAEDSKFVSREPGRQPCHQLSLCPSGFRQRDGASLARFHRPAKPAGTWHRI